MKLEQNTHIRNIVIPALVAAAYAALTMLLAPISYGLFQFRVSEILCILPFFFPHTAWGLFVGCAIANLMSPIGALDIIFGSMASLLAALATAKIGIMARKSQKPGSIKYLLLACSMPVIVNAPIIGAMLAYTMSADGFLISFAVISAQIAFEEAVVVFGLGLPVMKLLQKREVSRLMKGWH